MSKPRRLRSRTIASWVAAGLAVVLVAGVVANLRHTTPHEPPDFVVPAAEDPGAPGSDIVTCERREGDPVTTPEGVESVDPLGRTTSSEIIECPAEFDGHVVVYVGEIVGDVLRRDGGAWVLMNDDRYALEAGPLRSHGEFHGYNSGLAVWLEGDLVELVTHPGGPRWRGDILRVEGVVRRTDPHDGGGLTIRASEGRVIAEAARVTEPLHRRQLLAAIVFVAIAAATVAAERLRARRR